MLHRRSLIASLAIGAGVSASLVSARAQVLSPAPTPQAGQPTAIAIGDSTTYASATCGWFELLCALANGRYQYVRNAGVNGNTTTQMAARFATDVAVYRPGIVFIMGAVNNIGASVSAAQAVIDYQSMIAATLAYGGTPIIVAAPPYNTSPSGLQAYNNAFQKLAQTAGIKYIDPWKTCVTASNGNWIDGTYTADGTHPTPKAARIGAAYALTQLSPPTFYPNLPQNNADTTGKISNCLFVNGSGGTPTGWTIDAAFTPTQTAGSNDVLGNWFNLTFSGLAAYKQCTGPFSITGISASDIIQIVGRIMTSGFEANGLGPNPGQGKVDASLFVQFSGGGSPAILLNPSLAADLASGGVFSQTLTIPAGVSGGTLTILIGPRSGTISGTFSVAQLQCFDLTKMV